MKKISIILLIFNIFITTSCMAQTTITVKKVPSETPESAKIYVTGNFNKWNIADENYLLTENSGIYSITLNSKLDTIQFKFSQGTWESIETDEKGFEIKNRILKTSKTEEVEFEIMGWKNSTEVASTCAENVYILEDSFYMPQLDRYRRIWIYLPPDYENPENSEKHYPVIYMHDGQNLFDAATSFSGEWNVDETLNSLYDSTGFSIIVVGIDNGSQERINELTPWHNEEYGGGEGQKYSEFIVHTLKPFIDLNYRTLSDRENTGIMGSSLGGLISFYMGLKYNDVFAKIGAFSPSFWINTEIYDFAREFKPEYKFDLYILAGGKESANLYSEVSEMEKILNKKRKTNVNVKKVANGKHNEEFWSKQFKNAILKLWE